MNIEKINLDQERPTIRADQPECFGRIDRAHCNVVNEKDCRGCRFFKRRSEIKNNPYYGFSYNNPDDHIKDMKVYKVNPEEVIY